ncbi:MAG: hypothetical protein M3R46_05745 [Actinomycetota bacterium]|nr:hypothetical protein [Actinomycetota bacterium]
MQRPRAVLVEGAAHLAVASDAQAGEGLDVRVRLERKQRVLGAALLAAPPPRAGGGGAAGTRSLTTAAREQLR